MRDALPRHSWRLPHVAWLALALTMWISGPSCARRGHRVSDDGRPDPGREAQRNGTDGEAAARPQAGTVDAGTIHGDGSPPSEGDASTIDATADALPRSFPPPTEADRPDANVVPPDLAIAWVAADAPRAYVPDDLHLLVDGGDGVFFRYGFAWAERRTYRPARADFRRVRVEVYAFTSPAGALARYDHESLEGGGTPWSAQPPPEALAGKVDAARLDADQLRLARGRFMAVLRYEDDAETEPTKLIDAAEPPLLVFATALGELLAGGTTDEPR